MKLSPGLGPGVSVPILGQRLSCIVLGGPLPEAAVLAVPVASNAVHETPIDVEIAMKMTIHLCRNRTISTRKWLEPSLMPNIHGAIEGR